VTIIRAISIAIWCLISGSATYAKPVLVTVRSGEHKEFSRLVFDFSEPVRWRLVPNFNGYLLRIKPAPGTINLNNIFKFIPKTRLRAVSIVPRTKGVLQLLMPRGQIAYAWELSPGKLVVDIKAGPPRRVQQDPSSPGEVRANSTSTPPDKTSQRGREPDRNPVNERAPDPPAPGMSWLPNSQDANGEIVQQFSSMPDVRLLQARRQLVAKLARAMTDGLISSPYNALDPGNHPAPSRRRKRSSNNPTQKPESRQGRRTSTEVRPRIETPLNIDATTAFDSSQDSRPRRSIAAKGGTACIDPSFFALGKWYGTKPAAQRIATLRGQLVGEFDRIRPAVLGKLVRLYIVEGFGAEARELIDSYHNSLSRPDILKDLATLVETGRLPPGNSLSQQNGCPGASNFWGFLATLKAAPVAKQGLDRLIKSLAPLPIDLRMRVGAIILSRLLDANQIVEATEVVRLIERAPATRPPVYEFEKARYELLRGRQKIAVQALTKLAYSRTSRSDRALLLLLHQNMTSASVVLGPTLQYARARAFQLRNDPLGKELLRTVLSIMAKQQMQTNAFQILDHERDAGMISTRMFEQISDVIFLSYNIKALDGAAFVSNFFKYRQSHAIDKLSDAVRHHVALGLLAVNLPENALEIIGGVTPDMGKNDRILLGRIYLQLGRPMMALEAVHGLSAPAALPVRRRALDQSGSVKQAADMLKAGETDRRAQDLAWQASRWEMVLSASVASRRFVASERQAAETRTSTDSPVMQSRLAQKKPHQSARNTLAFYRKVLEESRKTQSALERLMRDHPAPKPFNASKP